MALVSLICSGIGSHYKDRQVKADKQDLHNQINGLTNQLTGITAENLKSGEKLDQLYQAISTNTTIPTPTRLALLNDELKNVSDERVELQKIHELSNTDTVDLKALRAESENELALIKNQKNQEAIQQEIDNIQKKKDAEEAAAVAEHTAKNQQWANEELVRTEKGFAEQILPIFDYAIRGLDKMLAKISDETGQSRHSDFLGETPTVYNSALVKAEMIVNGTNVISIGTNSAWNFKISTSIAPLHAYPYYTRPPTSNSPPDNIGIPFGQHYTSISITGGETNNETIITIEPHIPWNNDIGYDFRPNNGRSFYDQISIGLNGANLTNGLGFNEMQPPDNYQSSIDKALRHLIETQDQQSPLSLKAGK